MSEISKLESIQMGPDSVLGPGLLKQLRPSFFYREKKSPERNAEYFLQNIKGDDLQELQQGLQFFILHRDWQPLLCESGIWNEPGFFSEISQRLMSKVLPKPLVAQDATAVLRHLLKYNDDWKWIEEIPDALWAKIFLKICPDDQRLLPAIKNHLTKSIGVLSLRFAGAALQGTLGARMRSLPNGFDSVIRQSQLALSLTEDENQIVELSKLWTLCERHLQTIKQQCAQKGVSLNLTFELHKAHQILVRSRALLKIYDRGLNDKDLLPAVQIFKDITENESLKFELGEYLKTNLQMMAMRITQHASQAGEHYITSTLPELKEMFFSALKGGAIVAILCLTKIWLGYLDLAPLFEAFIFGLTYAIGFLCIHWIDGTLATKQPAVTAPTIAASIEESKNTEASAKKLAGILAKTSRSQVFALLGNLVAVIPIAGVLSLITMSLNFPLLSAEKAEEIIRSNHPLYSGSFLFAAFAGVCLFLSGVFSGWATNWFAFNDVANRLRISPLMHRFVDKNKIEWLVGKIESNITAWTGNIFVGFALGSVAALGQIIGLGLDVRHVTLAAGSSTIAMVRLSDSIDWDIFLTQVFSVLSFGIINLAVSFALALGLAFASRGLRLKQMKELFKGCFKFAIKRPLDFFWPPRQMP
jgi:site-specific recombinase